MNFIYLRHVLAACLPMCFGEEKGLRKEVAIFAREESRSTHQLFKANDFPKLSHLLVK